VLTCNRRTRPPDPLLSLVVPVRDEADAVEPFLEAVGDVLDGLKVRAEIVFVNDGSTDTTLTVLLDHQRREERLRVVNLSRCFGKEAAVSSGLDHCAGDIVVPIDVDLQDPPELLVELVDRWRDGYDVVHGARRGRHGDPLTVRLASGLFYRIFNLLSPSRSRPMSGTSGCSTAG
jgi:glycosyltransferase involved in cell wall biosynthesis